MVRLHRDLYNMTFSRLHNLTKVQIKLINLQHAFSASDIARPVTGWYFGWEFDMDRPMTVKCQYFGWGFNLEQSLTGEYFDRGYDMQTSQWQVNILSKGVTYEQPMAGQYFDWGSNMGLSVIDRSVFWLREWHTKQLMVGQYIDWGSDLLSSDHVTYQPANKRPVFWLRVWHNQPMIGQYFG